MPQIADQATPYIGRFAPSPTGPLHEGSLLCAVASYLDAKAHQGQWLLRIEDLDPPREMPGADLLIIEALKAHGLHWDGDIMYQSHRLPAYQHALNVLSRSQHVYPCTCRRVDLANVGGPYPGYCRTTPANNNAPHALRLKVDDYRADFVDGLQGRQSEQLSDTCGDYIIRRKDGLFSYQLAVAIDDAAQNVSHVVRGIDLLDSTARQLFVFHKLGYPLPSYTHIPVLVDEQGTKLSKQTGATAIDNQRACDNLLRALHRLQQPLPSGSESCSVESILQFAVQHWSLPSRAAFIKL